jgi:hypothetical protein
MTADLVTCGRDVPDKRRAAIGNPTQDKKCRANTATRKHFQNSSGIDFDSHWVAAPFFGRDDACECLHMKVVFNIYG